jgi:hypothetical protein
MYAIEMTSGVGHIHSKFHDDRFSHLNNIVVITKKN